MRNSSVKRWTSTAIGVHGAPLAGASAIWAQGCKDGCGLMSCLFVVAMRDGYRLHICIYTWTSIDIEWFLFFFLFHFLSLTDHIWIMQYTMFKTQVCNTACIHLHQHSSTCCRGTGEWLWCVARSTDAGCIDCKCRAGFLVSRIQTSVWSKWLDSYMRLNGKWH